MNAGHGKANYTNTQLDPIIGYKVKIEPKDVAVFFFLKKKEKLGTKTEATNSY